MNNKKIEKKYVLQLLQFFFCTVLILISLGKYLQLSQKKKKKKSFENFNCFKKTTEQYQSFDIYLFPSFFFDIQNIHQYWKLFHQIFVLSHCSVSEDVYCLKCKIK